MRPSSIRRQKLYSRGNDCPTLQEEHPVQELRCPETWHSRKLLRLQEYVFLSMVYRELGNEIVQEKKN